MLMQKIKGLSQKEWHFTAIVVWTLVWTAIIWFLPLREPVVAEPEVIVKTEYIYIYEECDHVVEVEEEPEPEPEIQLRYGFTDDDIYLMTVLLCGSGSTDGDGEYDIDFSKYDNHEQISLVLSVVMNRVMSEKFPNTVSEVIWAPGQFSPMPQWKRKGLPTVSERSHRIVREWTEAYDNHDLSVMSIPENHLYFTGNGRVNKSRERW